MREINTIVVGQGIAGSLVSYFLHLQKVSFIVIDPVHLNTSSRIAAGMFTPISGKRKTTDQLVFQQINYAIKIYREIELLLNSNLLHLENIYQIFNDKNEEEALISKSKNTELVNTIAFNPDEIPFLKQPYGAHEILHSGWLNCNLFISQITEWLKQTDSFLKADFVYSDLKIGESSMEYHDITCKNIIFCEGYQAINNPFFDEKIIPCKGDILTVEYKNLNTRKIIKKNGIYFIPTGENTFKAGSTYKWNNNSTCTDKESKLKIEEGLQNILSNEFVTLEQQTAIRPTTINRNVIAIKQPDYKGIFMLNGLGTKGVLQGPWWANEMVNLCLASQKSIEV